MGKAARNSLAIIVGLSSRARSALHFSPMVRIAITPAAFSALAATLPLGSVAYEPELNAKGERLVWLEPRPRSPTLTRQALSTSILFEVEDRRT